METGGLHAYLCSDSSQLHPSLRDSSAVPRRPSEAMPLSLAGNGVRWMPPTAERRRCRLARCGQCARVVRLRPSRDRMRAARRSL
eukprot:4818013-Prymnesium_polylepis.1